MTEHAVNPPAEPIATQRLEPLAELPVEQHAEHLESLYRELAETLHENGA